MKQPTLPAKTHLEIEATLAVLAAVQPRVGLEHRVLARLASAPALPWYRQLFPARYAAGLAVRPWMLAAASAVIVASAMTVGVSRSRPAAPVTMPAIAHMSHPAQQAVAAASGFAINEHPFEHHTLRTRRRGVHRSFRAVHERSELPRGTVAPMHPLPLLGAH